MKLHQHGNEIIVTELRPMSDCPKWQHVLLNRVGSLSLQSGMLTQESDRKRYVGWLPMPQYRPELKPIDK